jgi:diguanylate cyclase (GGDEF)-like protein
MRWWAIGLAVLGLGGLLVQSFRWRTSLLRRRNLHLEALVRARTRELEAANTALEEASMVDPLTDLKNRRYVGLFLPEEAARALRIFQDHVLEGQDPLDRGEDLLFLMIDLDHFKDVNDTYGHASGDAVLQQFAALLRRIMRESNTLVRWGGEEFLVVARRADRCHAPSIAAKIVLALRDNVFELPEGRTCRITCSIGFSAYPLLPDHPDLFSWKQSVELADQCLYVAKHSGRDGWVGAHFRNGQEVAARLGLDLQALEEARAVDLFSSFPAEDRVVLKPGQTCES